MAGRPPAQALELEEELSSAFLQEQAQHFSSGITATADFDFLRAFVIGLKAVLTFFGLSHLKVGFFFVFFFLNNLSKMGGEGGLNWKAKLPDNNKVGTSIERQEEATIFVSGFYRAVQTIFNM